MSLSVSNVSLTTSQSKSITYNKIQVSLVVCVIITVYVYTAIFTPLLHLEAPVWHRLTNALLCCCKSRLLGHIYNNIYKWLPGLVTFTLICDTGNSGCWWRALHGIYILRIGVKDVAWRFEKTDHQDPQCWIAFKVGGSLNGESSISHDCSGR